MPGALTWDPTPPGGSQSTSRGGVNPAADGASLSSTEVAATRALVSEAGNIAAAALLTTTGTTGQVVRLSDGEDKGAVLMWSTPDGATAETWCWWLWPQASYF